MTTYKRICLRNEIIEDKGKRLELKRGEEYITSAENEEKEVTVFSSFWAYGIPVEWFGGEVRFT